MIVMQPSSVSAASALPFWSFASQQPYLSVSTV